MIRNCKVVVILCLLLVACGDDVLVGELGCPGQEGCDEAGTSEGNGDLPTQATAPEPQPTSQPPWDELEGVPGETYDLVLTDWYGDASLVLANSENGRFRKLVDLNASVAVAKHVAVSPDGNFLAYRYEEDGEFLLSIISLSEQSAMDSGNLPVALKGFHPSWNPDSTKLVFVVAAPDQGWEVRTVDLSGTQEVIALVSSVGSGCITPTWSPEGDRVVFTGKNEATGQGALYAVDMHSMIVSELYVSQSTKALCGPVFSYNGTALALREFVPEFHGWVLTIMDSEASSVLGVVELKGAGEVGQAQWSPNDMTLVFTDYDYSMTSNAIYTLSLDGMEVNQIADLDSGVESGHPQWSPDGTTIAFTMFDQEAQSALVSTVPREGGAFTPVKYLGTGVSGGFPHWLPLPVH